MNWWNTRRQVATAVVAGRQVCVFGSSSYGTKYKIIEVIQIKVRDKVIQGRGNNNFLGSKLLAPYWVKHRRLALTK